MMLQSNFFLPVLFAEINIRYHLEQVWDPCPLNEGVVYSRCFHPRGWGGNSGGDGDPSSARQLCGLEVEDPEHPGASVC